MHTTISNTTLAAFLLLSLACDLRTRRIPNILTATTVVAALIINSIEAGNTGIWFTLTGCGAGIALLLIPFAAGGIGGGDVKMLAAVGALKGAPFVFAAFLLTAIAGGIFAVAVMLIDRDWKAALRRYRDAFLSLLSGSKPAESSAPQTETRRAFPYAGAIAVGTAAALFLQPITLGWW